MYQIIRVALRHWKPVVALNSVIMVVAIAGILTTKKTWTARAQLILPSATTDLNANLGTLGNVKGGEGLVFTQQVDTREILSKILLSNKTLEPVLNGDPEKADYTNLAAFRDLFSVKPSDTSTTIGLAVEAPTPALSEQRLKRLVESFQVQLDTLRRDNANERSRFMQDELLSAEKNLRQAEARLLAFQRSANLADGETQTSELVRTLNSLTATQAQLNAQLSAAEARVGELSAQLGQTPDQALQALRLQANSVYQANRRRLAEIEVALSQNRIRLTDEHPLIVSLLEEQGRLLAQQTSIGLPLGETGDLGLDAVINNNPVSQLSQQLVTAQGEVVTLQSQSAALQRQIGQLQTELNRMPAVQSKFRDLQRQYSIAEGIYNGLIARSEATRIETFSSYPSVQVLDVPRVDAKPSGSERRVVAMGAVLTALLGSAAIVLLRESQNPLLSPDDIKHLQIPILGRIPSVQVASQAASNQQNPPQWRTFEQVFRHDAPIAGSPSRNGVSGNSLGSHTGLDRVANAEFQRSASALSRMALPKGRLLVSSASAGEGKTPIAIGLAAALNNLGFRVLLVDADRRNRELSQQLGYGVASDRADPSMPIRVASQLDLLPLDVEPSFWGKFLAQDGFRKVLDSLQADWHYDYVLIDVAPISTNSELSLLLAIVPQVLLVLYPGRSLRQPFVDSLDRLQQCGATVPGLILNGVDQGLSGEDATQPTAIEVKVG